MDTIASPFRTLRPQAPDPLLPLIAAFREDDRRGKIDLGVGVYRDADGATPVFSAVKKAEAWLIGHQETKAYLGPEGDLEFLELLAPLAFSGEPGLPTCGIQTPGGTGAVRLAAELLAKTTPRPRLWLGTPSWPIHAQIFDAAGVEVRAYRYFDARTQTVTFDEMSAALEHAAPGDAVLLHGCCHNPSGADLSTAQWQAVAGIIGRRGLIPLIDLAYQGLGEGLTADAQGARLVLQNTNDALIAYSCDKNFGLYRERTGALFASSRRHLPEVRSNLLALARTCWSMPPDHGAAAVRHILSQDALRSEWALELTAMRERLQSIRRALAACLPMLGAMPLQRGLFGLLPISTEQVAQLRNSHAIYMAGSGRINIAGLSDKTVQPFCNALHKCLGWPWAEQRHRARVAS